MFTYLLQGFALGGSAVLQPGPLQAFLLSETMRRGWRRTLPAAFAPLLSDGPILVLVLLLLTQMPSWLLMALQVGGGCFLLLLAWRGFQAAGKTAVSTVTPHGGGSIWRAALLNVLNPNPYIYWGTVAGPVFLAGWRETAVAGISFMVAFYGTLIGGFAIFVLIFGVVGQLSDRVNYWLGVISAVAMALFGLYQIGRVILMLV